MSDTGKPERISRKEFVERVFMACLMGAISALFLAGSFFWLRELCTLGKLPQLIPVCIGFGAICVIGAAMTGFVAYQTYRGEM